MAYFGAVLYYEGKPDEAEPIFERSLKLAGDSTDGTAQMLAAFLFASRNQRQKIDPKLLRYGPDQIVDGDGAYWIGGIHALLGEKHLALEWLKRTVELGDVNYPWFERDKNYDSLRHDPEYKTMMAGIHQRWQAYKNEFDSSQ
jgi:tetratricopeptide (TPR) repeat protein